MSRQQHYIPQLYLKGFLDPESLRKENIEPYLWYVDVEKGKIRATATRNAAKAAGFYDYQSHNVSLEDQLAKIESLTGPIIVKLRNQDFELNVEERFHLSVYIGLQISRVPTYREFVKNTEIQKVRREVKRVLKGRDEGINPIPPNNFSDYLIGVSLKAGLDFWTKIVFTMNWVFILAPKKVQFYFSDNPAALLVPSGLPFKVDKNLNLWFPISPSCALLGQFGDVPDGFVDSINSEIALSFNFGILPTIQRYAFCATKEQAKWVLKQHQKMGRRPSP